MAGKHDEGYDEDSLKNEEYEQQQHEQAWAEIQCTEECMKEEQKWESYEEAQQRKEMQKKVEDELGVMTGNWAENAINMTQKYKDAGVKDPIEAGIEATIKGLTDMPTSRTVPVFHDHVEGEPGRVPDSDDEGYGASMYLQDESAVQQSIIQSYEQYMNPPDAEIHQKIEEMKEQWLGKYTHVKDLQLAEERGKTMALEAAMIEIYKRAKMIKAIGELAVNQSNDGILQWAGQVAAIVGMINKDLQDIMDTTGIVEQRQGKIE